MPKMAFFAGQTTDALQQASDAERQFLDFGRPQIRPTGANDDVHLTGMKSYGPQFGTMNEVVHNGLLPNAKIKTPYHLGCHFNDLITPLAAGNEGF